MYEILLYNINWTTAELVYIADITPVCNDTTYEVNLNRVGTFSCNLDLKVWKRFCARQSLDPFTKIKPYQAFIKIKRNGEFLPMAFEIKQAPKAFNSDSNITINAKDVFSIFSDRLVTKFYSDVDSSLIARDLITLTQAKPFGDIGVTFGNSHTTGVLSQRTYERDDIQSRIEQLADDASGGFDFWIDDQFRYWSVDKRGSVKDDITYIYGDDENSTVTEYANPEDATVITNSLTTVGEGIGDPITATASDSASQATYGLREGSLTYSSINNVSWLQNTADAELRDRKDMFDLPTLIVKTEQFDLNSKWVGDTIPIQCTDSVSPYIGNGRIQKLKVSLSETNWETITVQCLKEA